MASKSTIPKSTQKSQAPPPSKTPTTLPPTSARTAGSLPTLEDVQKTPGTPITATELLKLQSTGSLPLGVTLAMHPAVHRVKNGGEEFVVVLVDAPPCGCCKVNGKKERCRQHRARRRHENKKSKKKDGMVKDDDSDRKMLGALRRGDSEEEGDKPIAGAYTLDKVVIMGPAGAAISVPVNTADNPNAAARAPENQKEPIKGILVKGPQGCPQFIPEDKIPKDENGEPKFAFFPDDGPKWNDKGQGLDMVVEEADPLVEKAVGDKLHVAGFVDINEAFLPVFHHLFPSSTPAILHFHPSTDQHSPFALRDLKSDCLLVSLTIRGNQPN